MTSSACHVISRRFPPRFYFPLSLVGTSPPFPFPIIKSLSIMIELFGSSTIQCKRERIQEDSR